MATWLSWFGKLSVLRSNERSTTVGASRDQHLPNGSPSLRRLTVRPEFLLLLHNTDNSPNEVFVVAMAYPGELSVLPAVILPERKA